MTRGRIDSAGWRQRGRPGSCPWRQGREAGTFYRTSGMSWKSALESSVPMESAMKNTSTRLKKAFWEHGTMRIPSREAALIMDTLRKPKPHTAEREETRARHYRGSRRARPRAGGEGWLQGCSPCSGCSSCDKTSVFAAGKVGMKPPGSLEKVFPNWPQCGRSRAVLRAADPRPWELLRLG